MVPLKNRFAALAYEIDEGMGSTIAGNAGNQCQDLMSDESSNMFFDWDCWSSMRKHSAVPASPATWSMTSTFRREARSMHRIARKHAAK